MERPWPTARQRSAFVAHIALQHSWYKHLSFVERAPFVVFLMPQRSGNDGASFGHLGYAWRIPEEDDASWRWDRDEQLVVAPAIVASAGFALGPFVSTDDNAIDLIVAEWASRARRDRNGYRSDQHEWLDPHTSRRIDDLELAHARWEEAYAALDERGRELRFDPPHPGDPLSLRHFREVDAAEKALYGSFQVEESRHIEDALNRLGLMHAALLAAKDAETR